MAVFFLNYFIQLTRAYNRRERCVTRGLVQRVFPFFLLRQLLFIELFIKGDIHQKICWVLVFKSLGMWKIWLFCDFGLGLLMLRKEFSDLAEWIYEIRKVLGAQRVNLLLGGGLSLYLWTRQSYLIFLPLNALNEFNSLWRRIIVNEVPFMVQYHHPIEFMEYFWGRLVDSRDQS